MSNNRGRVTHSDHLLLPPCDGPKLHPFKYSHKKIKWIKRLDQDREDNEGFVFQVEIASKEYALKVFKFTHPKSNRYYWGTRLQNELPLDEALYYTDPFYAECRAYGKIQEGFTSRRVLQHTAVKCYGYLLLRLDYSDELWLRNAGTSLDTQLLDDELRQALGGDTRVRAIVKHLEANPKKLDARNIRRALRSVYLLNDTLKIYNMDIKADNFIGYRLVDFGSSWTEPHALLEYLERENTEMARDKRLKDKGNFDDMIEENEIPTRLQVLPTSRHQLRSMGESESTIGELPKRRRRPLV